MTKTRKRSRQSRRVASGPKSTPKSEEIPEYKEVRIGDNFQSKVPDWNPGPVDFEDEDNKLNHDTLVWAPGQDSADHAKVDEYLAFAKDKHGYDMDQALGMLAWHNDIKKATADLVNFKPFEEEWSTEERAVFNKAFEKYAREKSILQTKRVKKKVIKKPFKLIMALLPGKSSKAIMRYYYDVWKVNFKKQARQNICHTPMPV